MYSMPFGSHEHFSTSLVNYFLSLNSLGITRRCIRMKCGVVIGSMTKSGCFKLWPGLGVQFGHLKPYLSESNSHFFLTISSMIIVPSMHSRWLGINTFTNIMEFILRRQLSFLMSVQHNSKVVALLPTLAMLQWSSMWCWNAIFIMTKTIRTGYLG